MGSGFLSLILIGTSGLGIAVQLGRMFPGAPDKPGFGRRCTAAMGNAYFKICGDLWGLVGTCGDLGQWRPSSITVLPRHRPGWVTVKPRSTLRDTLPRVPGHSSKASPSQPHPGQPCAPSVCGSITKPLLSNAAVTRVNRHLRRSDKKKAHAREVALPVGERPVLGTHRFCKHLLW